MSRLSDQDVYLFREGTHSQLYERLGAHVGSHDGRSGCFFSVWAPNAARVSVIGDFNAWKAAASPLTFTRQSGIWEGFLPGVNRGMRYKYRVESHFPRGQGYEVDKTDPFAFFREEPPESASIVWNVGYDWGDSEWMRNRVSTSRLSAPWSIYEVHLGSWKRRSDGSFLDYREQADELARYATDMGFTHVELLPVMEHPYYPSWGYQITGFFAPTSRYGKPQDFMYLVDRLHRAGIGVILDWVPSHFPSDAHGLGFFDGTYLYEHADPRKRIHPDWYSLEFNYGRGEVSSFLLSSARFWLDKYHADALRVDAVASMLYLDYSRKEGGWEPNRYGGRENLEAIEFLRRFNQTAYAQDASIQTIAEESTAWPMVSRPTYVGGLGFGMKWDMGFMHDTLAYFKESPQHRKFHQEKITFRPMYAFSENFTLPLSHDEVVHGKGSLLAKMPGDEWQQFANLRLLFGYMWGQPGKKLLFMGGELGVRREWSHDLELEWFVLDHPYHRGIQSWVRDLNRLYRDEPALHALDCEPAGFQWVNCENHGKSVLSFLRRGGPETKPLLAVYNFSTNVYHGFRVGVPLEDRWQEKLNSDSEHYGGSGQGNLGGMDAEDVPADGHPYSLSLTLPALAAVFFAPGAKDRKLNAKAQRRKEEKKKKKNPRPRRESARETGN
jgi:1,4-alpha-glucan branching enzyme